MGDPVTTGERMNEQEGVSRMDSTSQRQQLATAGKTDVASATVTRPRYHRSEETLRATLSMLCNYIWTKHLRAGDHLWSIPVDFKRDFDCILSDAIDELVNLRKACGTDVVRRLMCTTLMDSEFKRAVQWRDEWLEAASNETPSPSLPDCQRPAKLVVRMHGQPMPLK